MDVKNLLIELKSIINYKDYEEEKYSNVIKQYIDHTNSDFSMTEFIEYLNIPINKFLLKDNYYELELFNKYSNYDYFFDGKEELSKEEHYNLKLNCFEYLEYINDLFSKNTKYGLSLIDYEINNTRYSDIIKYITLILYLNKQNSNFIEIIDSFNNFLFENEIELIEGMSEKQDIELCKYFSLKFFHHIHKNPEIILPKETTSPYTNY